MAISPISSFSSGLNNVAISLKRFIEVDAPVEEIESFLKNNPKIYHEEDFSIANFAKDPKYIPLIKLILEYNDREIPFGLLLYEAIRNENIDLIRFLIERGINIEVTFDDMTPLYTAVLGNREDIVEILLKAGAKVDTGREFINPISKAIGENRQKSLNAITKFFDNPNHQFRDGWTMLHFAALFNNCSLIVDLMSSGADICARAYDSRWLFSPYHANRETLFVFYPDDFLEAYKTLKDVRILTPCDIACYEGHVKALEILYNERGDQPFEINKALLRYLMQCERLYKDVLIWIDSHSHKKLEDIFFYGHQQMFYDVFGKREVLATLSNPNVKLQYQEDWGDKYTYMLHFAAKENNASFISDLLERGADPHLKDCEELTPISLACLNDSMEALDAFYEAGFEVNDVRFADSGGSLAHFAVINNKPLTLKWLYKNGYNLDEKNSLGYTPLWYAIFNSVDILSELLKYKVDPNSRVHSYDNPNTTYLQAAQSNEIRLKLLIEHGARVNEKYGSKDWTLLHEAAYMGELELVKFLIKNGADVEARTRFQQTPLLVAVKNGHKDIVEKLLKAGAQVNARIGKKSRTALHVAIRNERDDLINLLIKHGADIDTLYEKDYETPLVYALAKKKKNIFYSISQFLNPNHKFRGGFTMLHCAARFNDPVFIAKLIRQGADVHALSNEGMNPFDIACQQGSFEALKALTQEGKIKTFQLHNQTLIEIMSCNNNEVVDFLKSFGYEDLDSVFFHGFAEEYYALVGQERVRLTLKHPNFLLDGSNTLLHLAATSDHGLIIKDWLQRKADPTLKNKEGLSPIALACQHQSLNALEVFHQAGININHESSAAQVAAAHNKPLVLNWLSAKGYHLDQENSEGYFPLYYAITGNHEEAVHGLLKHGAHPNSKVNSKNKGNSSTYLQIAARSCKKEIVTLLIQYKANIESEEDRSPLGEAIYHANLEAVQVLIEHNAKIWGNFLKLALMIKDFAHTPNFEKIKSKKRDIFQLLNQKFSLHNKIIEFKPIPFAINEKWELSFLFEDHITKLSEDFKKFLKNKENLKKEDLNAFLSRLEIQGKYLKELYQKGDDKYESIELNKKFFKPFVQITHSMKFLLISKDLFQFVHRYVKEVEEEVSSKCDLEKLNIMKQELAVLERQLPTIWFGFTLFLNESIRELRVSPVLKLVKEIQNLNQRIKTLATQFEPENERDAYQLIGEWELSVGKDASALLSERKNRLYQYGIETVADLSAIKIDVYAKPESFFKNLEKLNEFLSLDEKLIIKKLSGFSISEYLKNNPEETFESFLTLTEKNKHFGF